VTGAVRAFVALGGNLGDRKAILEKALAGLASADGVRLAATSAAFENPPVGGPPQPDYWNAVAEVRTTLAPKGLHAVLRRLEDEAGRVRAERDGPRTLDLDLLAHGGAVSRDPALTLPHARALDRAFTLGPWAEIAPEYEVPGSGGTVLEHAAALRGREPASFRGLRRAALLEPATRAAKRPAVLGDREALAAWRDGVRGEVGFVPTMGALHAGHASLARRARAECDAVLVSLFVNPLQFGPKEDFSRYPRTLDADLDLLGRAGVDALYAPASDDLYPPGFSTAVEVAGPSEGFEGAARPGHFRGVATVVALLVSRARPARSYFGRKDGQQCAVVRRLAADLGLPGAIVVGPTVRDLDGLALSSRNRYLSPEERGRAVAVPRALAAARDAAAAGERDGARLEGVARGVLEGEGRLEVGYAAVVDPDSFEHVRRVTDRPLLMVVAARCGLVRLLDNEWMVVPRA
jgi:pantoate--beta-alanine ligase